MKLKRLLHIYPSFQVFFKGERELFDFSFKGEEVSFCMFGSSLLNFRARTINLERVGVDGDLGAGHVEVAVEVLVVISQRSHCGRQIQG
jgi:hypothetical protein